MTSHIFLDFKNDFYFFNSAISSLIMFLIAEIGINHNGNILAEELITNAKNKI